MDLNSLLVLAAGATTLGTGLANAILVAQGLRQRKAYERARPGTEPTRKERPHATTHWTTAERSALATMDRDLIIDGERLGVFRQQDGTRVAALDWQPANSFYEHTTALDELTDGLARLLSNERFPNTVIQFRFQVGPDPGLVIHRHLKLLTEPTSTEAQAARILHTDSINYLLSLAEQGSFRTERATIWVYAPPDKRRDSPRTRRELERTVRELRALFNCRGLSRQQCWEAIWRSHRRGEMAQDRIPQPLVGDHLPAFLGAEELSLDPLDTEVFWHGMTPVAVVSLLIPPQPHTVAGAVGRALLADPTLRFTHTIIVNLRTVPREAARRRLDAKIKQMERALTSLFKHSDSPEAQRVVAEAKEVRAAIIDGSDSIVSGAVMVVVYGPPIEPQSDKTGRAAREAVAKTRERAAAVIAALRKLQGAEAVIEEAPTAWTIYPQLLAGEARTDPTGWTTHPLRELARPDLMRYIDEQSSTIAALVPLETPSQGALRPHTVWPTTTGRLVGVDLFDRRDLPSPLALIVGSPGSGKSVLLCRLISDVLASLPHVAVRAVDYGRSLAPLVELVGGRYLAFDPHSYETINIWDAPELDRGMMPDETHITAVVNDLLLLGQLHGNRHAEDLLRLAVTEVYKNALAARQTGLHVEPQLSHLLDLLANPPTTTGNLADVLAAATEARIALENLRGNPWVDAPTAPRFRQTAHTRAAVEVFELDSVELLPERIRGALAARVAYRTTRAASFYTLPDGTRPPTLLVFDECGLILPKYPQILETIERASRTGRKENSVTILASQAWEDFTGSENRPNPAGCALVASAGIKLIGKQLGQFERLAKDCDLSPQACAAIRAISTQGNSRQWFMVRGAGNSRYLEMFSIELSPLERWTFGTNPVERDARALIAHAFPQMNHLERLCLLAARFPTGLSQNDLLALRQELAAP